VDVFVLTMREKRAMIAAVAVTLGLALAARYLMIENGPLGRACELAVSDLFCTVRLAIVHAFNNQLFGASALIFSSLALWRPSFAALTLGMSIAAAGLVLYNTTGAALAFALSLLVFARPATKA
jgi:glycerol uptake facilitator-like aquaporin